MSAPRVGGMAVLAAAWLLAPQWLQASASGGGSLELGGWAVQGHPQVKSVLASYNLYEAEFKSTREYELFAALELPLGPWMALKAFGSRSELRWHLLETIAPGIGTLRREYQGNGLGYGAELTLHTHSFFRPEWRPLPWRSPKGPLYWPELKVRFSRHGGRSEGVIAEETGWFSGNPGERWDWDELWVNGSLHLPLHRRLSARASYGHKPYYVETGSTWAYSERDRWDSYEAAITLHLGVPDPDWSLVPGARHAGLGWPGQWNLGAYGGWNSCAGDPGAGGSWAGATAAAPFNDLLGLEVGANLYMNRRLPIESWTGFSARSVQRNAFSAWLAFRFNLGSPRFRGVGGPRDPA